MDYSATLKKIDMKNPILNKTLPFVVLLVLVLLPHVLNVVHMNIVISVVIGALFATSLNMLLSHTRLLSFGHALFFGTGAYATALSIIHIEGLTLLPAIGLGVLAAAALALICTPLLVRVSGTAFAMLTMAFGQLMYVLCLKFRDVTGGEDGLTLFDMPPLRVPGLFSLDMTNPTVFYYVAMIFILLSFWCMRHFMQTPLGSVQAGIRDNPLRVGFLGYHVPATKAIVFVLSGAFAGLAGALFAIYQQVVSVDGFLRLSVSFTPIMAIMLGGIGTFFGPAIGVGFLTLLNEIAMKLTDRIELVYGVVFIAGILYFPYGVYGLWLKVRLKWLTARDRRESAEGKEPA